MVACVWSGSQSYFCTVIILSSTCYCTVFCCQGYFINIDCKLGREGYVICNSDSASGICDTIRPFNEVVTSVWSGSQCYFCTVIVFASTCYSTISCRKSNSINIDCKFGSESQIRSNRNSSSCICNTVRPFYKMMPFGWSSSEGDFCAFWVYSTSSNSTIANCRGFYIEITYKLFQINCQSYLRFSSIDSVES